MHDNLTDRLRRRGLSARERRHIHMHSNIFNGSDLYDLNDQEKTLAIIRGSVHPEMPGPGPGMVMKSAREMKARMLAGDDTVDAARTRVSYDANLLPTSENLNMGGAIDFRNDPKKAWYHPARELGRRHGRDVPARTRTREMELQTSFLPYSGDRTVCQKSVADDEHQKTKSRDLACFKDDVVFTCGRRGGFLNSATEIGRRRHGIQSIDPCLTARDKKQQDLFVSRVFSHGG
ncbi:hypothetical protein Pmar_PMAR003311 [Perkinsus marinus ATCC 50983]|uniref:Uncharacterized protein n=1 Tax=Perkinsus marinus (strain ATCC 50983 / TXsc) TaxID=423536 RepID=C5KGZ7_PERM5|nr:hypothetical protein Pmar_PMAR003311 [Perkinsus marinus ATCC 50983]EER15859.1 hypothetical protein Pmar_PMAR003311 [Perkinsus marinus ATCC 50983]|eukprot:XP_002784063.1 hypothetical protein Pmar_PMAR003311 [Perkinsus marinus ATCC 50983]